MHTMNPAGLALLVCGAELPSRLQAWLPDVPVACAASPGELAARRSGPAPPRRAESGTRRCRTAGIHPVAPSSLRRSGRARGQGAVQLHQ